MIDGRVGVCGMECTSADERSVQGWEAGGCFCFCWIGGGRGESFFAWKDGTRIGDVSLMRLFHEEEKKQMAENLAWAFLISPLGCSRFVGDVCRE